MYIYIYIYIDTYIHTYIHTNNCRVIVYLLIAISRKPQVGY